MEDLIKLDDDAVITVRKDLSNYTSEDADNYHNSDVNVAIAAVITAGARVYMSHFKNNPAFKLYYSDTDCVVINRPLPEYIVGKQLGLMKLEHIIDKAVFLAPKVYSLVLKDGTEITKIKGISIDNMEDANYNNFKKLLTVNTNLKMQQDKWFKSIAEGAINIRQIVYHLRATANKREAIYANNVFTYTNPYFYDDIIIK